MTTLTLIGKPDCHLCDVAHAVTDGVLAELPGDIAGRIELVQLSILDDAALYEKWWEKIPVLLIDGVPHTHWRVDAGRLRAALEEAS